MINFKHYYKSDEMVGTGDYVFRRISSESLAQEEDYTRAHQYIEGTLEEILPEDFGNITEIIPNVLYSIIAPVYLPLVNMKIELPDTVTNIGANSFNNIYVQEIIMPKNIAYIEDNVLLNQASDCVVDFSKAKSIPTLVGTLQEEGSTTNNTFNDSDITIKVPQNLYSAWINSTLWKDLKASIVAV